MPGRVSRSHGSHTWYTAEHERKLRRHTTPLVGGIVGGPIWLPSETLDPDVFTISGPSDVTHALSYKPYGLNAVMLNGLGQSKDTDFTINWTTGVITLLGTLIAGDVLEVWYVTDGSGSEVLVPWNASGWRYKQVTRTDATDYSASTYDDSAWSVDRAPFGTDNGSGTDFDAFGGYNTNWDLDTRLWIRRDVGALDVSRTVRVSVRIDNVVSAWWNDTLIINEYDDPAGGLSAPVTVEVPSAALDSTTNILAIRATDDAPAPTDKAVVDCQVTAV